MKTMMVTMRRSTTTTTTTTTTTMTMTTSDFEDSKVSRSNKASRGRDEPRRLPPAFGRAETIVSCFIQSFVMCL